MQGDLTSKEMFEAALKHLGVDFADDHCEVGTQLDRCKEFTPMLALCFRKKGKTRVVVDVDPDFPYFLIRVVAQKTS